MFLAGTTLSIIVTSITLSSFLLCGYLYFQYNKSQLLDEEYTDNKETRKDLQLAESAFKQKKELMGRPKIQKPDTIKAFNDKVGGHIAMLKGATDKLVIEPRQNGLVQKAEKIKRQLKKTKETMSENANLLDKVLRAKKNTGVEELLLKARL